MRRVIFVRKRRGVNRAKAGACAYAFVTIVVVRALCPQWPCAARDEMRSSGLGAGYFPVLHHLESISCCRARLQASNAIPHFNPYCLDCSGVDFGRRVTPPGQRVTMALHTRNAKNIFAGRTPLQSVIFRVFTCNVGQIATIFLENTSVSCAVHSSIDCMMMNRNRIADFPCWPTFMGVFAHVPKRGQGARLPFAGRLGAP